MSERPSPQKDTDPARREMLAKMGRYAGYTAPLMMTLLISDRASAKSGRQREKVGWKHKKDKKVKYKGKKPKKF